MATKFVNLVILSWCDHLPMWKELMLQRAEGKAKTRWRRKRACVKCASWGWVSNSMDNVKSRTCPWSHFHRDVYLQGSFRHVIPLDPQHTPTSCKVGWNNEARGWSPPQGHRLVHHEGGVQSQAAPSPGCLCPCPPAQCKGSRPHQHLGPLSLPSGALLTKTLSALNVLSF